MIPYKQLSLAEIFQECQEKFNEDKYSFLSLLEQNINLDELIPISFKIISTLLQEGTAYTLLRPSFGLCLSSVFSLFQPTLS
jgi:hypothetical protein